MYMFLHSLVVEFAAFELIRSPIASDTRNKSHLLVIGYNMSDIVNFGLCGPVPGFFFYEYLTIH